MNIFDKFRKNILYQDRRCC